MLPFRSPLPAAGRAAANLAAVAACAAMLGVALYEQHVLGRAPCHLCILQRIAVIGIGLVFLAAALHRPGAQGARRYAVLAGLVASAGALVAGRNVWIQLQPAGSVPACSADLNVLVQMLPLHEALAKVFLAGGECQRVYTFLGVALPVWVLVAMAALTAWAWLWNVTLASLPRHDAAERALRAAQRH
jgi:disulfide bond formation protein DsbB